MISKIRGKIDYIDDSSLVVLTSSGIGYNVFIFNVQKYNLGDEIELFIFHKQTEKEDTLWGFNSANELTLAKIIITVNGIGIKIAQSLILNFGAEFVADAILNSNYKAITMTGVGPKTAQKITNALSSNHLIYNFTKRFHVHTSSTNNVKRSTSLEEATSALEALGFTFKDINKHLIALSSEYEFEKFKTQEIIKLLLKHLKNKK